MKRIAAIVGALALFALDRTLKWYAAAAPPHGYALIPGVQFVYFQNQGLVFSLSTAAVAVTISTFVFALVAVLAIRALQKHPELRTDPRVWAAGAAIALGGASNIFDRITAGGVIDYILFFNRSAVNIADGMILAGIVICIALMRNDPTGGLQKL